MEIQLKSKDTISKADITTMSVELLDKLENGELSPLLVLSKLKAIEKIGEAIKARLIDLALSEIEKHPKGDVEIYGATFKKMEAGVSWDFSQTGDPLWEEFKSKAEEAQRFLKEREAFLKTIKGSETIVDTREGSGEICTVYEPIRKSTTTIQTAIK